MLVRTELVDNEGDVVKLDYILRKGDDDHWRIVNVVANGVSELSVKRVE